MAGQLFIYLGPDAPAEVSWSATGGAGRPRSGRGPLAQVPKTPGERLVVLVPGSEVLVTEIAVPGRRGRLPRRSLPFLLEENLAAEVEELHFATGPAGKDGRLAVAVVARARMEQWLALLAEAGLSPAALVPATLAVPVSPGGWTLVLSAEGFLARRGDWQVFAGETDNLARYLDSETSLGAAAGENEAIQLFNCSGGEHALAPPAGLTFGPARAAQLTAVLAEGCLTAKTINLLQGDYARSARWRETVQRWRLPLAAAAALLLLLSLDLTLDYLRLRKESARLQGEIVATFKQAFPGTQRIVNARAQMTQKLAELRDSGRRNTFFALYDKMAPLVAAAGASSLELLRFHEGRLVLDLTMPSLPALEKLKDDLAKAPGIAAEIGKAENSGGQVRARLSLEARN